jgi:hypothetical protein
MSTLEQRRERAKDHLDACKGYLVGLKDYWEGLNGKKPLTDFMKDNMIGSACILIDFSCDFIEVTEEWVKELFRENGGWGANHPFTKGVVLRLGEWKSLAASPKKI